MRERVKNKVAQKSGLKTDSDVSEDDHPPPPKQPEADSRCNPTVHPHQSRRDGHMISGESLEV